jgi:putative SOS response-associated peptidase YedK
MLTTEPGPDVEPYHNRQVVVLRPEDRAAWIYLTKSEADLLRPLPMGSLDVATARDGSN